jgi:alpha-N-arabinofuranosidase
MNKSRSVEIDLRGTDKLSKSSGEIITSDKENDYNDFGQPEKVNIKKFSSFSVKNNILKVDLPAKSVVTIELKK